MSVSGVADLISLEIGRVEFELESSYSGIDLDLVAGDLGQVAGRRASRARHQAVLSRLEGKPDVGPWEKDRKR